MKYVNIGLAFMLTIVVVGIVLSTGVADKNNAPEVTPDGTSQTPAATPETTPTDTVSTAAAGAAPEKVSAEALTCTIDPSGYNVDLKLTNPGAETRKATISPLDREVTLLPGQIVRLNVLLPNEGTPMNILLDNGDQLSVQSPSCTSRGGDSGDSGGATEQASQQAEQLEQTPPAPVPELSTFALMSTGIVGLLLVLLKRKN